MPISLNYPDPTSTNIVENAYCYLGFMAMDFASKTARFEYHIHRDEESAYTGKKPMEKISITVKSFEQPAKYTEEAEPILISDAIPSFDQLVANNVEAYTMLAQAVYGLALTQTKKFPNAQPITQ